MKIFRKFCVFLAFFPFVFHNCHLFAAEFHRMNYLSDEKAREFLVKVCRDAAELNAKGKFTFKLSRPSNAGAKTFGEISYAINAGKRSFAVNFDSSGCVINGDYLSNTGDGNFSMDEPFFENLLFCPRDLQFIFVDDDMLYYVAPAIVFGRPVQQFLRTAKLSMDGVNVSCVKISIDEKLMAVLQVDFLDAKRTPIRRISVNSFKNFDGLWMPKVIEIFNFKKRCRTKLEILSAKSYD
jgi:hypothetical protein